MSLSETSSEYAHLVAIFSSDNRAIIAQEMGDLARLLISWPKGAYLPFELATELSQLVLAKEWPLDSPIRLSFLSLLGKTNWSVGIEPLAVFLKQSLESNKLIAEQTIDFLSQVAFGKGRLNALLELIHKPLVQVLIAVDDDEIFREWALGIMGFIDGSTIMAALDGGSEFFIFTKPYSEAIAAELVRRKGWSLAFTKQRVNSEKKMKVYYIDKS